jgi:hypothetical protein
MAKHDRVGHFARRRTQAQLEVAIADDARFKIVEAAVEGRLGKAGPPRTAGAYGRGGLDVEFTGLELAIV